LIPFPQFNAEAVVEQISTLPNRLAAEYVFPHLATKSANLTTIRSARIQPAGSMLHHERLVGMNSDICPSTLDI
jgi:hypothetical protein